jgi:hypothetical protein
MVYYAVLLIITVILWYPKVNNAMFILHPSVQIDAISFVLDI